jgi:uncharacterized membrane protein YcaP (DUF421 family)
MNSAFQVMFGEGPNLAEWQMAARAAVIFAIALALIRVSGRRSFGQHSPFDACTTVLLGAILSRAVVGASPFWSTVGAATALALMHRISGQASVRWPWFEAFINGHERTLVESGKLNPEQMRRALITRNDLEEAIRKKLGCEDVGAVNRAVLERNGDITVMGKKREPATD